MTTAERLVQALAGKKMTCATAESCTGGGVGHAITGVPGSSAVFMGGVISYDNSVKRDVLGVPDEVLATKGAVSSECAAAMAKGARRLLKTDLAVSLTGIALFTTRASLLNIVSKEAAQIACFVKLFSIILSKKYPVPFLLVRGILCVILS